MATAEDVVGLTVFSASAVLSVDWEAPFCARADKDGDSSASAPQEFLLFFLSSPWATDAEAELEDDVANMKEGSLSLKEKRGFEDEEEEKEAEDDIENGPERRRWRKEEEMRGSKTTRSRTFLLSSNSEKFSGNFLVSMSSSATLKKFQMLTHNLLATKKAGKKHFTTFTLTSLTISSSVLFTPPLYILSRMHHSTVRIAIVVLQSVVASQSLSCN